MAQAQAQVPSPGSSPLNTLFSLARSILIPVLAVVFALLIGAVIILISGANPISAYSALFNGSFGDARALNRTIERATPLVFGGLAVSFAFKAGLLNIGAQGQLIFGAILAGYAGFAFTGLPAIIHIPLALLIGGLMGALWGSIPGVLKAYTGAHEVITTIMLNYVAFNITDYLSNGPWRDDTPGNVVARTPAIAESAALPSLGPVPLGFVLALVAVLLVWWLIWRMTFGFELRTVGQNPNAAHYAGMSVRTVTVLALVISGALAGLGGAVETLGVNGRFQPGFNVGLGFTAITVALLARTSPFGVIPAALLIGAMQAGTSRMQFDSGVAPEIIELVQALILFFVAADVVIRWILRIRANEGDKVTLSSGWGS